MAQHLAVSRARNHLPISVLLSDQDLLINSPRADLELRLPFGREIVVALPRDEGAAGAAEVPMVAGDDLVVGAGGGDGRGPGEGGEAHVEEVQGKGAGLLAALGAEAGEGLDGVRRERPLEYNTFQLWFYDPEAHTKPARLYGCEVITAKITRLRTQDHKKMSDVNVNVHEAP
ncbi:hypothetical protein V496_00831 [Pseudogymnoascus sp. VKM F-4515 (FW-2607)]|nr:hypothetical protein V496_00831 [Pseudogymnoascus sp. VKM F-4515 (FW-2607)]